MISSCTPSYCPPSQGNTKRAAAQRRSVRPIADVLESADHYQLILEMPGVSAEQVDLRVERRQLTVQAERSAPDRGDTRRIHGEHSAEPYVRRMLLSDDVDSTNISATCSHGLVTILLPKREERRPRKIQVQGG